MIEKTSVFRFDLGLSAEDAVTGFKGVITGRADYVTGCNQYCLSPRVGSAGTQQEGRWFDETRLKVDARKSAITLPEMPALPGRKADRPGGPASGEGAPTR